MEDFDDLLQRKLRPSELSQESVGMKQRLAFRRRPPVAVFKPPFAAWRGNTLVVSEKEKRKLDFRRCAMKSVKKLNP
jgi:hypothetical protein